jgi:hypothetical protein
MQATPMQLVIGCDDATFDIQHNETQRLHPHTHAHGDLVLIKACQKTKCGYDAHQGPLFPILGAINNGAV